MPVYYTEKFPPPTGQLREQIYDWARKVARWFEKWVVLQTSTASTAVCLSVNNYAMDVWAIPNPVNKNQSRILNVQVYKGSTKANFQKMVRCVFVYPGTDGEGQPAGAGQQFNFSFGWSHWAYRSAIPTVLQYYAVNRGVTSTTNVTTITRTIAWSLHAKVFGPHGVFTELGFGTA